jgi:hypothetical protein
MSFKETISGRRESAAATFHKFRVDPSIRKVRHIFVEGYEDLSFYARHVPNDENGAARFHVCFGKKNLDQVAELYWTAKFKNSKALFIRDSDFDRHLKKAPTGPGLFLTCGYAVENYVCSEEAIEKYLSQVFCLDNLEVNYKSIVEEFISLIEKLHAWLGPLYGAAMYAMTFERKLDMDQFDAKKYIKILLNGKILPPVDSIPDIALIGLTESDFNPESVRLGDEFKEQKALRWVRGKYLLSAVSLFLHSKKEEFGKRHKAKSLKRFNRKPNPSDETNLFLCLSSLADATIALQAHLKGP